MPDLVTENRRLRVALARANWRIATVVRHVTNRADHTAPCAVLAADVRDILTGARDPQNPP